MSNQLEFPWLETAEAPPPAAAAPAPKLVLAPERPEQAQLAADSLHAELKRGTGLRVQLSITNNSSTMMSVRHTPGGSGVRVRLHHMFLGAPPEVRAALTAWIKKPRSKQSAAVLDGFIRENQDRIRPAARRPAVLRTEGAHHDLPGLAREINDRYFGGNISAQITWGRMPRARRRRSIRFGSYSPRENLIRIHPLLDQPFVPEFFVSYILFHEMLHAALGIEESPSGRRCIHTREFKRQERLYPDYERALAWMEEPANLNRLLSRAKR